MLSLGTLTTIEYQREALENANTNTEVLKIMGTAAKALKGAHNNMDIDKVRKMTTQYHISDFNRHIFFLLPAFRSKILWMKYANSNK